MKISSKGFIYELVEGWGGLDKNVSFQIVSGLGIDDDDNIYILTRGKPSILVIDKEGNYIDVWGDKKFGRAHALALDLKLKHVFVVDDKEHCIYMFDKNHRLLDTLGTKGPPSDIENGKPIQYNGNLFNGPTDIAFSRNNDIYVTDGYGNARIHCFDIKGNHKFSWGEPGTNPSNFNLPHGIVISKNDIIYVADRGNNRIQLFDLNGKFITEWNNFWRPAGLFISKDNLLYVAECMHTNIYNGVPSRITILSLEGEMLARLSQEEIKLMHGKDIGYRCAHSVVVDSEGSIYIGEVGRNLSEGYIGLQKYKRIH